MDDRISDGFTVTHKYLRGSKSPMIESKSKLYKAITRPDKAVRWSLDRISRALESITYRTHEMNEMNELEAAVYKRGTPFIPGTRDKAEFITHVNKYRFFRRVIASDRPGPFRSLFVSPPHITILDLGCGVGYGCAILSSLRNCSILGIDMFPEAIQYASEHYQRPNVQYRVADILEFVGDMNEYDYIVSSHVLEHIQDGYSILPKLKFRKKLIISTPYDEAPGNPHHALFYLKEDVYAGFPNKKIYYDDRRGRIYSYKIVKPIGMICVIEK
ncbi:Ubiquinone biosynthesis O-methyltransferase [subsurface metagenome]